MISSKNRNTSGGLKHVQNSALKKRQAINASYNTKKVPVIGCESQTNAKVQINNYFS